VSAAPAGWPADLAPVGFESQVSAWLLDRLPPEYRTSAVRKHPLVLAMAAHEHALATLEGTREVYRSLRSSLRDFIEPSELDASLVALEALAAQFSRTLREVELVQEAMRGRVWKPRL
jgi:hypothetical protein